MSVVPYLIYGFNTVPIKIPKNYFTDIDKLILKFIQRGKRPRIANTILKNKVGGMMLPTSRLLVIKTVWYQRKNRHIDQWNRTHSRQIEPHKYSQLIFSEGAKRHTMEQRQSLQQMALEQLDIHKQKKRKQIQTQILHLSKNYLKTNHSFTCKIQL